ncbi:MAG: acyl-CoA thioesterase [Granulosicoccus sp.]
MSKPEGHFLYQLEFPVRWGDMDALGHVNNIMYFRYFEQVRLQWFEQIGYGPLGSESEGLVIVDNHAEYIKSVVYPMNVCVSMHGHSPGRSSFVSVYTLSVDGVVYTRGSAKIVWIDTARNKSIPLPESIRALVSAL